MKNKTIMHINPPLPLHRCLQSDHEERCLLCLYDPPFSDTKCTIIDPCTCFKDRMCRRIYSEYVATM